MRKLSFIMAVLMILVCMPIISISAAEAENAEVVAVLSDTDKAKATEGYVAKLGDAYCKTVKEAVDAADDGDTITLISNYVVTARENWGLKGRNLTIDMNTFSISNRKADGTASYSEAARIINLSYEGTTAANTSDKPGSALTMKNGYMENATSGGNVFQIYNYITLNLYNVDCDVKNSGNSPFIVQGYGTLYCKDCKITNLYDSPTNITGNTGGNIALANAAWGTITFEDCDLQGSGGVIKYVAGGINATFKRCTVMTECQNAFISDQGDCTLNIEDCVFNIYTKASSSDTDLGAFDMMYGNRNKVYVKDTTINVANANSDQYVVDTSRAAKKTALVHEYTNVNVNATCCGGIKACGDVDFVINGGNWFVSDRMFNSYGIELASGVQQSRVNIYDGNFTVYGVSAKLDGNVTGDATPTADSLIFRSASTGEFNIYGGNFYMYSTAADAETPVLATAGAHVLTYGDGDVNVRGGNFYGGEYAVFKAGTKAYADVTDKYAMPEDGDALLNVTTREGASVRVDADLAKSGIRFEGTIGEDVFDFITKYVAKATDTSKAYAGIAIVPADYLGENGTNGVFTFDALAAKNLTAATTKADKGLVDNKNGTYTLRLSLVNIREANYSRDFVAIAYVAYENNVIYAPETSGERSIEFVAKSALADVKPNETVADNGRVYNTPVTEKFDLNQDKFVAAEAGMASKYNLAQIDLLKAYITVKE